MRSLLFAVVVSFVFALVCRAEEPAVKPGKLDIQVCFSGHDAIVTINGVSKTVPGAKDKYELALNKDEFLSALVGHKDERTSRDSVSYAVSPCAGGNCPTGNCANGRCYQSQGMYLLSNDR